MKRRLRFLADMNISPVSVDALQRGGWDVVRVSTLLPTNSSDAEILALARRQDQVVITHDLDFSALLALGGHAHPSLITLRLSNTDPAFVTERLRQVYLLLIGGDKSSQKRDIKRAIEMARALKKSRP